MSDTETGQQHVTEGGEQQTGQQETQTFTQADIDKMMTKVRGEERRKASEKYADYDDLKTKAGEKATLDERVAQIEQAAAESERRALRAEVANAKGLTASQAKRLVGITREELESDADDLLKDIGAQKKQGNYVAREGASTGSQTGGPAADFAQFLGQQLNHN